MEINDCLLVIGEITMQNRFLEERVAQLEAQVSGLQNGAKERAVVEDEETSSPG